MESFFTINLFFDAFEWRNNENNYPRTSGISLLLRRVDMSDFPQGALKAGWQNCNNAFHSKMMNSRLSLLTFERRNISFLKTIAPLTNRARVSCDSTVASRKTRLDANLIGRCHRDYTFDAFQPMGIFRFFSRAFFFLGPHPHPVKYSVVRLHPVPSRFYQRVQRS